MSVRSEKKLWRNPLIAAGVVVTLAVITAAVWWLTRPAQSASIAVAGQVHSLTLEVLCGEKLVWDLPLGEIRQRSVTAARPKQQSGATTLSLSAGARVRMEASSVGALNLAVDRVESIARGCGKEGPSFEVMAGDTRLPHDASGFFYAAAESKPDAASVSLPLKGRIVLGRPIQHGGGWKQADSAVPESIVVTRRVVPAFSNEKVTVGTDRLDDGSILDTHGCLDSTADETRRCAARESELATGFLRASAGKGLEVQLYVRGPVGVRTYEGERQYLISIPKLSVALQSERLVFWLALFAAVVGAGGIFFKPLEYFFGGKRSSDDPTQTLENAVELLSKNAGKEKMDEPRRKRDDSPAARAIVSSVTLLLLGLTCSTSSLAEPVEVRQEGSIGGGYSFRRGSACQVITANHVVKEMGAAITVEDKSGARAAGSRTYASEENDLALITLSDGAAVACTTPWPAIDWLRSASFSGSSAFRAVRHYTSGREAIVRLTHAGGDRNYFSLAPVDKLNIRESDSGTIVEFEGKPVGIVLSVDTATDRVRVLRFDRIDELVGERFRGSAAASLVSFLGVLHRGRENPTWTQYIQAWMTEKAGRTVIAPSRSGGEAAKAKCEVKVEVLAWEQARVANPERDTYQLPLKACGKKGFFYEQMCKQAKESLAAAPPYVASQRLTVNVTATPKGAPAQSKLVTSTLVPQSGKLSRADVELSALQATAGPPLSELFSRGVCD